MQALQERRKSPRPNFTTPRYDFTTPRPGKLFIRFFPLDICTVKQKK